jgi:sodium/potassium-transporting ATPase subunit alpha
MMNSQPQNVHQQDAHKIPLAELLKDLSSKETGLTAQEALQRLKTYGANVLEGKKKQPELIRFLMQFKNYFAVLLIIGGILAVIADKLDPGVGNQYIAYALFGVVLLNAAFTYMQERHTERIMESFSNMLPQMVSVIRDNHPTTIRADEVVPGDVILISEGDRICADARLIEHNQLKVDLSSLTGESEPQLRHLEATHENILESRNMVFSGSLIQSGVGKAVVYNTGMQTQLGHIVELTKETKETESPIHKELSRFTRIIGFIAITLGVLFFALSVAIGKGQIASLIFAIGIIVANVPEGLLPTVTLALSMASRRMANKNALIKSLESVETLGSTNVICTDKTGTLTQNRISISTIIINGKEFLASDQSVLQQPGSKDLLDIMTLCNNAYIDSDGVKGDPTEGALLSYANELIDTPDPEARPRLSELPFDSSAKRMITVNPNRDQNGSIALLKGAPEAVTQKCSHYQKGDDKQNLTEDVAQALIADFKRLALRGERVLAFGYRHVDGKELTEETGFTFVGLVGMQDPPRTEVPDAIKRCRRAGIKIIMITGDYGLTAETIARQIGLITNNGTIVRGDELSAMNDEQLKIVLQEPEIVFARTSPNQKLRIVQTLQSLDLVVTVTGDGVNDAPALKNADMGVAMGIMGTDVAKEASDMVLMDDNFATIVSAIEEGRTIFDNIKKFIAYILTSNVPEILPFIGYVVLDIPLPLTVVLILAIDLGTDIVPALGLGGEKPESDVMKRPPRARNERLLTRNLLFMSYGVVGMVQAAAGFFSYFVVLYHGGWQWGQKLATTDALYQTAVTAFFASIIICQVADVLICRTRRQSIFTVGLFSNHLVLIGIAAELVLLGLITYLPICNTFFNTAPLEVWQLALSIPFALLIVAGDEIRRLFVRRENRFVLKYLTW